MYKKSGYSNGYTKFNSARTFKKTTTGTYKTKAFSHKPYYKHHRSTNSATTAHGRVFKTIETVSFTYDQFRLIYDGKPVMGYLVLSTHAPLYTGPTINPYNGNAYEINHQFEKSTLFLKSF